MSKQYNYNLAELGNSKHTHGDKALEMIMRDVIDGMEEIANMAGYSPQPGSCFEILEIVADEPEQHAPPQELPSADIVPLHKHAK